MLNTNAKKLVKALRSGKYKQGHDFLRPTEDTFCCLGVACDLYRKKFRIRWGKKDTFLGEEGFLPPKVADWYGFRTVDGRFERNQTLIRMNDTGSSFEEIAAKIESEPKGLFKKIKKGKNTNARR